MTSEAHIAWCAGVIDTEGSLGFSRTSSGLRLQLRVVMIRPDGPKALRGRLGVGTVYAIDPKPPRRRQWVWQVSKPADIETALDAIASHLVMLTTEVEIARRYLAGEPPEPLLREMKGLKVRSR